MADFNPKFTDLVRNFTTTSGTANFVLGQAVTGYSGFAQTVAQGERFYYCAMGIDKPAEREVGRGTLLVDGTVAREPIAGQLTNFSNGTKIISLVVAAEWYQQVGRTVLFSEIGSTRFPAAVNRISTAGRTAVGKAPASYIRDPDQSQYGGSGAALIAAGTLSAAEVSAVISRIRVADAAGTYWMLDGEGQQLHPGLFGAVGDGASDDSAAVQAAIDYLTHWQGGGTLHFLAGTYRMSVTMTARVSLRGAGMRGGTILKPVLPGGTVLKIAGPFTWHYGFISDLTFSNDPGTSGIAIQFGRDSYTNANDLLGGHMIERCRFENFDKCIARLYGNFGLSLTDVIMASANFHIWSRDSVAAGQGDVSHMGCLYVVRGQYDSAQKAHAYFNGQSLSNGQVVYDSAIVEGNPGFGIFIKDWSGSGGNAAIPAFELRNPWFELNATAASVVIDGISYTPREIYARNCPAIKAVNSTVGSVELVNSTMQAENCGIAAANVIKDADSVFINDDGRFEQAVGFREYSSNIRASTTALGTSLATVRLKHRTHKSSNWSDNILYSADCRTPFTLLTTGVSITTTSVNDGVFDTVAQELQLGGAETVLHPPVPVAAGKYVVGLLTLKIMSGAGFATAVVSGDNQIANLGPITSTSGEFQTLAFIGKNGFGPLAGVGYYLIASAATTVRFAGMALLSFDTKQEAIEFLESGAFPVRALELRKTVSYEPPSLPAAAQGAPQSLAMSGAAIGDKVDATFSQDLAGVDLRAWVSAEGAVKYVFDNRTAAAVDLPGGTVTLTVRR